MRYALKYKVGKVWQTSLLFSNVIDAEHQNSSLFKTKAIFHHFYGF